MSDVTIYSTALWKHVSLKSMCVSSLIQHTTVLLLILHFNKTEDVNRHKFFRNRNPRQFLMYSEIQYISDINQQYSKQTHRDQWCILGCTVSWVVFLATYARMRGHISKCIWINTYKDSATICDPAGEEINEPRISTMVVLRIQWWSTGPLNTTYHYRQLCQCAKNTGISGKHTCRKMLSES